MSHHVYRNCTICGVEYCLRCESGVCPDCGAMHDSYISYYKNCSERLPDLKTWEAAHKKKAKKRWIKPVVIDLDLSYNCGCPNS